MIHSDAFIGKLNNLNQIDKFKYIGGNDNDVGYSVDLDSNNDVFLYGTTASSNNFPTPDYTNYYSDNFHSKNEGVSNVTGDCYIYGFNKNLILKWGTYFHGAESTQNSDDFAYGMHISPLDEMYIVGATTTYGPGAIFPLRDLGSAFYDETNTSGIKTGLISRFNVAQDEFPTSLTENTPNETNDLYKMTSYEKNKFLIRNRTRNKIAISVMTIKGKTLTSEREIGKNGAKTMAMSHS